MSESSAPNASLRDTLSHGVSIPSSSTSKDARAIHSGLALRVALLTLLERKPYGQITVREICAQAGVHCATFSDINRPRKRCSTLIATDQIRQLNELSVAMRQASDYEAGLRTH